MAHSKLRIWLFHKKILARDLSRTAVSLFSAHWYRKSLVVACLPASRERYARHYFSFAGAEVLRLEELRPFTLFLARALGPKAKRFVFSDWPLARIPKAIFQIPNAAMTVFILAWNDELEIDEIRSQLRALNVQASILSLFKLGSGRGPYAEVAPLKPVTTFSGPTLASQVGADSGVFFAGQANTTFFDAKLLNAPRLRDALEGLRTRILREGPAGIFPYFERGEIDCTGAEWAKIRHYTVNYWRREVLAALAAALGDRLTLCGVDFQGDRFKQAKRLPSLGVGELYEQYRRSKVNIDCGSQCGLEAFYPRSCEILTLKPGSLAQVRVPQSAALFGDLQATRTFASPQDLVAVCTHLLATPSETLAADGEGIRARAAHANASNAKDNRQILRLDNA